MKLSTIIAASLVLALAGCHRGDNAATGGSATTTPRGGVSGQASEGSTEQGGAPKRPSTPSEPPRSK
jgi:hypothetical protein